MSQRQLQRALAAVLMDEEARRRFARSPRAFARAQGLRGREAAMLAGLDPGDVGYFASRRRIDRRSQLRADMPLTVALLEREKALLRYFRAHPYAFEDPLRETARVARWTKAAARRGKASRRLVDAAALEDAWLALRNAAPAAPAKASPRPRRTPGVRVLQLAHDLAPAVEADDPAKAEARPCWVVLRHGPDGPEVGEVDEVDARLLLGADGKRSAGALAAWVARAAQATTARVAEAHRELAREGLVSPLPRGRGRSRRKAAVR